jgi:D-glycero-D-manno-heptose 1,7-bisphosphate phosphatase
MLERIHAKLTSELAALGGSLADIFFCPHHPDDNCFCRKPQPGLFLQIREKYAVDLAEVYFVGDSVSDIQAAKNVNCKPILVLTGNGQKTLTAYAEALQIPSFPSLAQVAEFVIHES